MCCTGASDAAAGAFAVRLLHDQRHAQRGVVERHARARFAVIADEQNRRLVVEPMLLERRREPGHRGVRIAAIDLHEQEEALAAPHLDPSLGGIDRQRALALERGHFVSGRRWNLGVEEREPLRQSGLRAQQERGHRRSGREAAVAEQLRERARTRRRA